MKRRSLFIAWLVIFGSFQTVQGESRFLPVKQPSSLDVSPIWSPDGSHIAFIHGNSDSEDIWIMDSDGGKKFNLTKGTSFNSWAWSPDGSKIVYMSQPVGTQMSSLLITDIQSGEQVNLTDQIDLSENLNMFPRWSPDGKYIAFSSSTMSRVDIVVANIENSTYTNITASLGNVNMLSSWSPDSQYLAVSSEIWDDLSSLNIWVIAIDRLEMVNVTTSLDHTAPNNPLLDITNLTWSPNSDLIAFSPAYPRESDNIYLVNQSGTLARNLTKEVGGTNPVWSPDGSKIVFNSTQAGNQDIWMISIDGSDLRNLTADNPGNDGAVSWSPDGSKFAFASDRGGTTDIWIMHMEDFSVINLTSDEH